MLPTKNRLNREHFTYLLKNGGFSSANHFTLRFLVKKPDPKSPFHVTECSFVVSKKIAKTAVLRNLMRRRGYDAIKTLLPFKKPYYLAFILKKGAPGLSFVDYKKEILDLLRKARVL